MKSTSNTPLAKKKHTLNPYVLLYFVIIIGGLLSYIITPGAYDRQIIHGKTAIDPLSYHSIEKYPLNNEMLKKLNYKEIIETKNATLCKQINEAEWNKKTIIKADTETKGEFSLLKIQEDFITFNTTKLFDIIYFDAFAPDKQPQLWTKEIFEKISSMTKKDGILTTYSAKGEVRRKLINSGFEVERLPGPPGKRQIIRAIKK